jgi:hypothetical protein
MGKASKKRRIVLCAGCGEKIRDEQPCVDIEDMAPGSSGPSSYHSACSVGPTGEAMDAKLGARASLVTLHHVCSDDEPGWDCSGGCFLLLPEAFAAASN